MKKITKIFLELLFVFLISFLSIDFLISNTILDLKNKSCNVVEEFYLELKKNCNGKEKIRPFLPTINIYTDVDGLRVRKDHKRSKNKKIFVYGSSFIYGAGIEYEKSVIGVLENNHKNYEFYNFSLPYGSPTFHLYRLKQRIVSGEIPEKIILVLSMSDILNETSIWGDFNNEGKPILINRGIYEKSIAKEEFYKRHFRLSRSIALNLRNKIRSIKNKDKNLDKKSKVRTTVQAGFTYTPLKNLQNFYSNESFNNGKLKIEKRIYEMLTIAKEKKIEFYLTIFPFADTLEYGQSDFNWENFAKSLCSSNNCILINSFPEYRKYKKDSLDWYKDLFFEGDEHFTELGHKILADKFTNQIF